MKRILVGLFCLLLVVLAGACDPDHHVRENKNLHEHDTLVVLAGSEQERLDPLFKMWASKAGKNLHITYVKNQEIQKEISKSGKKHFDAVIVAQPYYIDSVDPNHTTVTEQEFLYTSLPVMVVRQGALEGLGWKGNEISIRQIITDTKEKNFRYGMPNPDHSTLGLMFLLGASHQVFGQPSVLTKEHLGNQQAMNDLRALLFGVDHEAGTYKKLYELFTQLEMPAMITYEFDALDVIAEMQSKNSIPPRMFYISGIPPVINTTIGFINRDMSEKKEMYESFLKFLKQPDTTQKFAAQGCRTNIGGSFEGLSSLMQQATGLGFDPGRQVGTIPLPNSDVVTEFKLAYNNRLRKEYYQVYALDFSDSMKQNADGANVKGIDALKGVMQQLLDVDKARELGHFYNPRDVRVIITFHSKIAEPLIIHGDNRSELALAMAQLQERSLGDSTNIHGALRTAYEHLETVPDLDQREVEIIFMTDGVQTHFETIDGMLTARNRLYQKWNNKFKIPIFAIGMGQADANKIKPLMDYGLYVSGQQDLAETIRQMTEFR